MSDLETAHLIIAELRSSLRVAYEAADRLCAVMMLARNEATDQAYLDKATRRLYGSLHDLEKAAGHFNAVCVRLRDGNEIKDGNGTVLGKIAPPGPPDEGPEGAA